MGIPADQALHHERKGATSLKQINVKTSEPAEGGRVDAPHTSEVQNSDPAVEVGNGVESEFGRHRMALARAGVICGAFSLSYRSATIECR